MARFKAQHHTVVCRELLGCDLGQAGSRAQAQALHLFDRICPRLIQSVIEILDEMLENEKKDA